MGWQSGVAFLGVCSMYAVIFQLLRKTGKLQAENERLRNEVEKFKIIKGGNGHGF